MSLDVFLPETARLRPLPPFFLKPVVSQEESKLYNEIIEKYHKYRASAKRVGRTLRFLVYENGKIIGCIGAAQIGTLNVPKVVREYCHLKNEDKYGTIIKQLYNENVLLDLYRFTLIEPSTKASKIISLLCKITPNMWEEKYKVRPKYIMTMVRPPFTGKSYKAAGWDFIGYTTGEVRKNDKWVNFLNANNVFRGEKLLIFIKLLK